MGSRESDRGTTALHSAALGGHPDVVRMLLRRGADAAAEDEQGCDAGFLAKRAGHHECQQILVQHSRGRFTSLAAQTITVSVFENSFSPLSFSLYILSTPSIFSLFLSLSPLYPLHLLFFSLSSLSLSLSYGISEQQSLKYRTPFYSIHTST